MSSLEKNSNAFLLPENQHEEIFQQVIIGDIFGNVRSQNKPIGIVFGGQPGAGKSSALDAALNELATLGGAASIIGDELRDFHPSYEKLLKEDDKTAAFYTDKDTGRWVEKAIKHALTLRCNVIIEGTMRLPEKVTETLSLLRNAGYITEARALAVNERLSWQGIIDRYETQYATRGYGRMTTPEAHQAGYIGMLKTLDCIEQKKLADRIVIYKRGGIVIYDNELHNGQWQREPLARITVENERNRAWTLPERTAYAKTFDKLAELIQKPDRQATFEEIENIKQLQQQAYQDLPLEKKHRSLLTTD
jgi:hypothetical protein